MPGSATVARRHPLLPAVLVAAAVAGYAGAAVATAPAAPPLREAAGFGPGDGLLRYVLTAEPGTPAAQLVAGLAGTPGVVTAQELGGGRALAATDGLSARRLADLPGVAAAEVSTSVPVLGSAEQDPGTYDDPYYGPYGWNLENTGGNAYGQTAVADADADASAGWASGTGAGRVVAVVDTGFDSDHPDLAGALWTNPAQPCGSVDTDGNGKAGDCHGWNFYADSADVDNGVHGEHGAAVAGVVGARLGNGVGSAGVAPEVQIMPLVIGGGSSVDVHLGAQAIRYAVDHGADVVNASWGGRFTGAALEDLRSAVAYAAAHDVLVVAAAGNDALDRDSSVLYPASLPDDNIVTVGSSDAADAVSTFSAYGATSVDLFAPGTAVATTWNDGGYRLVSGTSTAAPHVAAAYALYRSVLPGVPHTELKQALLDDVQPLPAFAGRSVSGGRLTLEGLAARAAGTVRYRFAGMTGPAGVVTPEVTAAGGEGPGRYALTIGLGMAHDGGIWAVSGAGLSVAGTSLRTDDTGTATVDLGTAAGPAELALSPGLELSDGRYVLTVQLHRDGAPLGRASAAPLLVGAAAVPPAGTADGGTAPASPAPGSPAPGPSATGGPPPAGPAAADADATGPAPGGAASPARPAPSAPVAPGWSGADAGATGPEPSEGTGHLPPVDLPAGDRPAGNGAWGGGGPGDGGTGAPELTGPGGTGGSGGAAGTPPRAPSGSGSGRTAPATDATGAPAGPAPGTSPAPGPSGRTGYPELGPFGITSISPTRVGTAGGTLVTITGTALPAEPRVRVGETAPAEVVRSSATELVFRAPARVAGSYDVHVFARDGRASVLPGALGYTDGTAPTPGDGPGGTPADPAPAGSGSGAPGTAPLAPDGPAGADGGADAGTDGGAGPQVRTGPGGQRLVSSTFFAGLGSVWSRNCSASCSGVPV